MKTALIITACLLLIIILFIFFVFNKNDVTDDSLKIVFGTWQGYKENFIDESGRVRRPKNDNDTVSEGQAYAMLRAVWMDDKETFDKCYLWTERNLSRKEMAGDNLLAWHWKDGKVVDYMPASDADIDYALSLIFAHTKWGGSPEDLESYGQRAKKHLADILNLETYSDSEGRIYLSPWILPGRQQDFYPVNPSYYSPAHFRVFYDYTSDERWLGLIETTYYLLNSLQEEFNGRQGVGLVPDWCAVDRGGKFVVLENKSSDFGYEALRVPFRIGLDYLWFKTIEAKQWLKRFNDFLEKQILLEGVVYCEYDYTGQVQKKYQSPAFYACYYYVANDKYRQMFLQKTREYLKVTNTGLVYLSPDEYYVNSLAWLAEAQYCGIIKNLYGVGK